LKIQALPFLQEIASKLPLAVIVNNFILMEIDGGTSTMPGDNYCTNSNKITHCKYVVVFMILLHVFTIACNEVRKLNYISFSEAVKAGEIIRGRIPDYLPKGSFNIHIIYDITSSETWCEFEFISADAQILKNALEIEANFLPARLQHIKKPDSWWPEFLGDNLNIQTINEKGFSPYILEEKCYQGFDYTSLLFFVIDWKNGKGVFHRTICQ